MKSIVALLIMPLFLMACSPKDSTQSSQSNSNQKKTEEKNEKGIGEVKQVTLNNPLEEAMVKSGKAIYEMKCSACHKLTDQRVVGPGWAGITKKRKPEWIMNMVTNVDIMLAEDPVARQLLQECLVRMPNQNISIGDARDLLEFMRHNDGEQ